MTALTPSLAKSHVVVAELDFGTDWGASKVSEEVSLKSVMDQDLAKPEIAGSWIDVLRHVYSIAFKAQIGHWNVVSPTFAELHAFFGEEYQTWAKHIDSVAEHARTRNLVVPSSLDQFAVKSDVPNTTGTTAAELIKAYHAQVDLFVTKLEETKESFTSLADNDIAGELAREAQKTLWKIRSMAVEALQQNALAKAEDPIIGDDYKEYQERTKLSSARIKSFILVPVPVKPAKAKNEAMKLMGALQAYGAKLLRVAGHISTDDGSAMSYIVSFNIANPKLFFESMNDHAHASKRPELRTSFMKETIHIFLKELLDSRKRADAYKESFTPGTFLGYEQDVRPFDVLMFTAYNPVK